MSMEIVGRESELDLVRRFVDGASDEGGVLVLEGDAGIGKSSLWRAGIEYARECGVRVLSSNPAEVEQGLASAGLGDLLEEHLDEVLPGLAPPRRRALEIVLLRDSELGESVDSRALAVAVRDALDALVASGRVLVAVDDVQWLDGSTGAALNFALRRLEGRGLRVLLTRRRVIGVPEVGGLEVGLELDRLAIGPLSAGALHVLLRDRLGRALARQTLLRIHERSGGNPFYALEIARALPAELDPLQPLPVPETLDQLVRSRISGLPSATREALALVAAAEPISAQLLECSGVAAEALEPAFAADLIERGEDAVRFTHPLLAAAVYPAVGEERRRIHARLAECVDDPLRRAIHIGLATEFPDSDVACRLDAAAMLALERGAPTAAAELAEQALRLTPPAASGERRRRALAAARVQLGAGEWTRARAIATELLCEADAGPTRAEVLLVLAEFEHDDLAVPLLEEALREAADKPALAARVSLLLAWSVRFRTSFVEALEQTREALALADDVDDDELRFDALEQLTVLARIVGDPQLPHYTKRAHALARKLGDKRRLRDANALLATTLLDSDTPAARSLLEHELREWEERDETVVAQLLWQLAWLELAAGRWELAAGHAARSRDIGLQYGVEKNQDYIPSSWIAAHRGQVEVALSEAERGLELSDVQIGIRPPLLRAVSGLVALWGGNPTAAVEVLGEADEQAIALGWGAPDQRRWSADYVQALLEVGRIDDARRVLERWERDGERLGRGRVLASVTRCRGLVAAAEGDIDGAEALLDRSVVEHEAVGDPFGRARALLALGIVRRRARQRRAAREAIEAALAGFEELGAAAWVDRARGELGRIGGRRREEGLTAAEQRVALLAAEGRTNQEIAASLFLSERTVASHLTHVYAKLGVRSRTELARKVQTF